MSKTKLSLFPKPYLNTASQFASEPIISPVTKILNYWLILNSFLFALYTFVFYAFLFTLYALSHDSSHSIPMNCTVIYINTYVYRHISVPILELKKNPEAWINCFIKFRWLWIWWSWNLSPYLYIRLLSLDSEQLFIFIYYLEVFSFPLLPPNLFPLPLDPTLMQYFSKIFSSFLSLSLFFTVVSDYYCLL